MWDKESLGLLFSGVTALATLLAAVGSVLVLALIYWQAQAMRQAHQLVTLRDFLANRNTPDYVEARGRLFAAYCADPDSFRNPRTLLPDVRRTADRVYRDYGDIGLLIYQRAIDVELAQLFLHTGPVRLWIVLRFFADAEDHIRGRTRSFQLHFKNAARIGFECWFQEQRRQDLMIFDPNHPDVHRIVPYAELVQMYRDIVTDLRHAGWISNWLPPERFEDP